jgi:hypothetical protein
MRVRSALFALLLIGVGVVLLLQRADAIPQDVRVWPIVLIGVGGLLLLERVLVGGPAGHGFVVPLVVVAIGLGFLLEDAGTFEDDELLVPLVVIAIGAGLILGAVSGRRGPSGRVEVALGDARSAHVEIVHGAGELRLRSHLGGGNLLEGMLAGGADLRQRRDGDRLDVTLKATAWRAGVPWGRGGALDWSVTLARHVPLELTLRTGASRTEADLSDLEVGVVRIDTGASATMLTLPATGRPRVHVRGGAAEIRIRVPARMAARIRTRGGLSDVRVDEHRFPRSGDEHRSRDYEESPHRADVEIESGAARVEVS